MLKVAAMLRSLNFLLSSGLDTVDIIGERSLPRNLGKIVVVRCLPGFSGVRLRRLHLRYQYGGCYQKYLPGGEGGVGGHIVVIETFSGDSVRLAKRAH